MIGRTISHYKITEKLGGGGMGVVYKAEDLKLDRFVALKFLPPAFSLDENAKHRLLHEAKAASILQHNNICTVHAIDETDDGQLFICMDYYEGESLKQKIERGLLKIDETIDITIQIAEGLSKAHDKNIVHRDIKPANIFITHDGVAKVLDFGLAKLVGSKTMLTKVGTTLGTVAYMSPEQARGENVDHRTDIWSLGAVLYEMVTGKLAFAGDYEQAIIYKIMNEEPEPITSPRSNVPIELERIVEKAMQKDRNLRYQHVDEMLTDLKLLRTEIEVEASTARLSKPSFQRRNRTYLYGGAGALVLLVFITLYILLQQRKGFAPLQPFQVTLRQVTFSEGVEEFPAWSQDGARLAYIGEVNGYRKIFLRKMATGEETQLTTGAMDDIQPTWSPDNKTVLFVRSHQPNGKLEPRDIFGTYEGGDIWMIDLTTGKELKIIENGFNPSYSPDGQRIAIDASWAGPRRIWTVDNRGRNPRQVSSDISEAVSHIIPRWSPDGSWIVFQNIERTKFDIKVVNVISGEMTWVTNDLFQDINPIWTPSGREIYFSSYRSGGLNVWRMSTPVGKNSISQPEQLTTGAGQDVEIAISPNGKRLAFSILNLNADIWKLPVSAKTGNPIEEPQPVVTTTREDSRGAWSPDGRMIAFNSDRSGEMNIWTHSISDGSTRQLTKGAGGDFQPNWSPDGKYIAFFSMRSGNADIWTVDIVSGEMKQLTISPSLEINPFYSSAGQYITYQSDAAGRLELWVMKSDGKEQRKLVEMETAGHFMRWSKDGKSVVFRSPNPTQPGLWSAQLHGGEPRFLCVPKGGSHISFSPAYDLIMDVVGHKELWLTPISGENPVKVFQFADPEIRIDYPVWSPDGNWILFDRVKPQGGDIWIMEDFK